MEFPALAQLINAIRTVAPGRRIIVFGSSSVFGSFPDDDPDALGVAITQDADIFIDPDDVALRVQLDEKFGEDRAWHVETGHFGDFVDLRFAEIFPIGWRERLVPMAGFENVFALHPLDMAATKVVATASSRLSRRMGGNTPDRGLKDINTIVALIRAGRLDFSSLESRVNALDLSPALTVECGRVMGEIQGMTNGEKLEM